MADQLQSERSPRLAAHDQVLGVVTCYDKNQPSLPMAGP